MTVIFLLEYLTEYLLWVGGWTKKETTIVFGFELNELSLVIM